MRACWCIHTVGKEEKLILSSFKGKGQVTNNGQTGKRGNSFKGIGNKLYCVLQLSVQKLFLCLLLF